MGEEIVIGVSGPTAEEDVPDGTYPLMLVEIGPWRPVDFKEGTKDMRDWIFRVHNSGTPYDGRTVKSSASAAASERSTQYGYIVALTGGGKLQVGQKFDTEDLVGRVAYGQVVHKENGWPKIDHLIAMPVQQLAAAAAPVIAGDAPVTASAQPALRETVATDDLPF